MQGLVPELKGSDNDKLKQIFNNAGATADEQQRIKIAFVEGYESGLQRQMRGRTMWLKIMQNMITISAIIVVIWLYRMYLKIDANFVTLKVSTLTKLFLLCSQLSRRRNIQASHES